MNKINLKVANDIGSNEQKLIINGELIILPNVYAKVHFPQFLVYCPIIRDLKDNLVVRIDSPCLIDTEGYYYIGNKAINSGQPYYNMRILDMESILDSKIPIINTISNIALYVAKAANNDNINTVSVKANVEMVTSLPGNQYKEAEFFSSKFMSGVHSVEVITGLEKSINVEISFDYVKTMLKGVASTFYLQSLKSENKIFDEFTIMNGIKVDNKYFEDKRILHCIIGDGTTDISITENDKFANIYSLQNGIGHATERILNDFISSNYLPAKFTRQDFYKVLFDLQHKYHNKAEKLVLYQIEWECNNIFRMLEKVVLENKNNIDLILIYGGGSILTKKYMSNALKKLEKVTSIKSFIIDKENALIIEVKGMNAFLNSNLFKNKKSHHFLFESY